MTSHSRPSTRLSMRRIPSATLPLVDLLLRRRREAPPSKSSPIQASTIMNVRAVMMPWMMRRRRPECRTIPSPWWWILLLWLTLLASPSAQSPRRAEKSLSYHDAGGSPLRRRPCGSLPFAAATEFDPITTAASSVPQARTASRLFAAVSSAALPWAAAMSECRNWTLNGLPGWLATPNGVEEDTAITQVQKQFGGNGPETWLGGNDAVGTSVTEARWSFVVGPKEDRYQFAAGRMPPPGADCLAQRYCNFQSPSEPNGNVGENCLLKLNGGRGHFWDDRTCSSSLRFLCEFRLDVIAVVSNASTAVGPAAVGNRSAVSTSAQVAHFYDVYASVVNYSVAATLCGAPRSGLCSSLPVVLTEAANRRIVDGISAYLPMLNVSAVWLAGVASFSAPAGSSFLTTSASIVPYRWPISDSSEHVFSTVAPGSGRITCDSPGGMYCNWADNAFLPLTLPGDALGTPWVVPPPLFAGGGTTTAPAPSGQDVTTIGGCQMLSIAEGNWQPRSCGANASVVCMRSLPTSTSVGRQFGLFGPALSRAKAIDACASLTLDVDTQKTGWLATPNSPEEQLAIQALINASFSIYLGGEMSYPPGSNSTAAPILGVWSQGPASEQYPFWNMSAATCATLNGSSPSQRYCNVATPPLSKLPLPSTAQLQQRVSFVLELTNDDPFTMADGTWTWRTDDHAPRMYVCEFECPRCDAAAATNGNGTASSSPEGDASPTITSSCLSRLRSGDVPFETLTMTASGSWPSTTSSMTATSIESRSRVRQSASRSSAFTTTGARRTPSRSPLASATDARASSSRSSSVLSTTFSCSTTPSRSPPRRRDASGTWSVTRTAVLPRPTLLTVAQQISTASTVTTSLSSVLSTPVTASLLQRAQAFGAMKCDPDLGGMSRIEHPTQIVLYLPGGEPTGQEAAAAIVNPLLVVGLMGVMWVFSRLLPLCLVPPDKHDLPYRDDSDEGGPPLTHEGGPDLQSRATMHFSSLRRFDKLPFLLLTSFAACFLLQPTVGAIVLCFAFGGPWSRGLAVVSCGFVLLLLVKAATTTVELFRRTPLPAVFVRETDQSRERYALRLRNVTPCSLPVGVVSVFVRWFAHQGEWQPRISMMAAASNDDAAALPEARNPGEDEAAAEKQTAFVVFYDCWLADYCERAPWFFAVELIITCATGLTSLSQSFGCGPIAIALLVVFVVYLVLLVALRPHNSSFEFLFAVLLSLCFVAGATFKVVGKVALAGNGGAADRADGVASSVTSAIEAILLLRSIVDIIKTVIKMVRGCRRRTNQHSKRATLFTEALLHPHRAAAETQDAVELRCLAATRAEEEAPAAALPGASLGEMTMQVDEWGVPSISHDDDVATTAASLSASPAVDKWDANLRRCQGGQSQAAVTLTDSILDELLHDDHDAIHSDPSTAVQPSDAAIAPTTRGVQVRSDFASYSRLRDEERRRQASLRALMSADQEGDEDGGDDAVAFLAGLLPVGTAAPATATAAGITRGASFVAPPARCRQHPDL